MYNKQDYHLQCLAEECNELAHIISKCLRFGINDYHPKTGIKNKNQLQQEILDVLALIELVTNDNNLTITDENYLEQALLVKQRKVERYYDISAKLGRAYETPPIP
jgi:NTP pyrophosphatase (non-canonical NTP hydrolase)